MVERRATTAYHGPRVNEIRRGKLLRKTNEVGRTKARSHMLQ